MKTRRPIKKRVTGSLTKRKRSSGPAPRHVSPGVREKRNRRRNHRTSARGRAQALVRPVRGARDPRDEPA